MSTPKILLCGRMRSGKDYIADQTGLPKLNTGQPIYAIAQRLFGKDFSKSQPGYRRVLQQIGQFGRCIYSEDYPLNLERGLLVERVRSWANTTVGDELNWSLGFAPGSGLDWSQFGHDPLIWARATILLHEKTVRPLNQGVIITNIRFENDLKFIMEQEPEFSLYYVLCSARTWFQRFDQLKEAVPINPAAFGRDGEENLHDISEYFAVKATNQLLFGHQPLDNTSPQIIWNDSDPIPEYLPVENPGRCFTVDQFLDRLKRQNTE